MTITRLEQSLIDNAKAHQEALAGYYHKFNAGQFDGDIAYWKHSGALTELVMLAHYDSGLSSEAAKRLGLIDQQDMDAQMRPFRELGRAALSPALADAIEKLKVRDKLLQALGAIEQTEWQHEAMTIRLRADTYAKSAMEHDQELSYPDWRALDQHIQERVAAKPEVRFSGVIGGKGKSFLPAGYSEIPKFGRRTVTVTQSLADLEQLPQATRDAILANAGAHVLFKVNSPPTLPGAEKPTPPQVFNFDPAGSTGHDVFNPSLEAVKKLHGCQVALLNQDELELLRLFMDQGRKSGVSVEFDTDADTDLQALAEMNSVSALEILAAANSYIRLQFA